MADPAKPQYTLQLPSRALAAAAPPACAAAGCAQWLAGTAAAREDNEVRLLQLVSGGGGSGGSDGGAGLVSAAAWAHPEEVWDVAPCPLGQALLATAHAKAGAYGATLWRAPDGGGALERLTPMGGDGGGSSGSGGGGGAPLRRVLWAAAAPDLIVTLGGAAPRAWRLAPDGAEPIFGGGGPGGGEHRAPALWGGALHPKDPNLLAAVAGGDLQLWDLRAGGGGGWCGAQATAAGAHCGLAARDADWGPSNEFRLVTAGDDGALRFWDTRALAAGALLALRSHRHWVWAARFHPRHEQLLATASSDGTAALWRAPGAARARSPPAATTQLDPHQHQEQQQQAVSHHHHQPHHGDADGRAAVLDADHEDSVYSVAWSNVDQWSLASLSYDGRVAVSAVPKGVKYAVIV